MIARQRPGSGGVQWMALHGITPSALFYAARPPMVPAVRPRRPIFAGKKRTGGDCPLGRPPATQNPGEARQVHRQGGKSPRPPPLSALRFAKPPLTRGLFPLISGGLFFHSGRDRLAACPACLDCPDMRRNRHPPPIHSSGFLKNRRSVSARAVAVAVAAGCCWRHPAVHRNSSRCVRPRTLRLARNCNSVRGAARSPARAPCSSCGSTT